MKNKQKKINPVLTILKATSVYFVLVVLFLFFASPALAQLQTGLEYGTATGLGTQDIRISIMRVVRIFLGFIGVIAILIVLYGGWMWMSSAGRPDRIEEAKAILRNAAIGLAIILLAFSIVSFIIGLLQQATIGGGGPGGGGPPGGACTNCGHLGSGIIERVYPAPNSRDNARNTNIMVSFKVVMDHTTIIDDTAGPLPPVCTTLTPCLGTILPDSVSIYPSSDENNTLDPARVNVRSIDGKTFVFDPIDYLGNTNSNVWYSTELTNDIQKDNGDTAFPGAAGRFIWRFEIGTFLDLDPVEVKNVFPIPDDSSDTYSTAAATQAVGSVTVSNQPNFAQNSATQGLSAGPGTNPAVLSGSYNCSVDTTICVTAASNGTDFNINPKTLGASCASPNIPVGGLAPTAVISAGSSISLGCGLTMTLDNPAPGNQWTFEALAQRSADTLRVGNTTYTFVQSGATGNQINLGATTATTAQNIDTALLSNSLITASVSGSTINLQANLAGQTGNAIVLAASGNWATVDAMSGGQNAVLLPTTVSVPDQPRNAAVVINFSEAIDPTLANNQNIRVQYFNGSVWVGVDGDYFVSNQFKTVEFLPDSECLDSFNNPIVNSCGEPMFCLPVIDPDPVPYAATPYRVLVDAGQLVACSSNSDCADPNFNICPSSGVQICTGSFDGTTAFYPGSQTLPDGIIDAANNTFNGNSNSYLFNYQRYGDAEGPQNQSNQSAYNLNTPDPVQGDDLAWEFYVNKNIDLTPPVIELIAPNINSAGVSLYDPISATFNEVMMSRSLKPGTGYQDGFCGNCTSDSQCLSGEVCDPASQTCVSITDEQLYCAQDTDCNGGLGCINKKYVTLIDQSTKSVGWWTTSDGLDSVLPPDGYPDQTVGSINHTTFSIVTSYGAEFGSGIQNVYQNCFIPSEGPDNSGDISIGACDTTPTAPFCCGGQALSQTDWEASVCFTGL